MRLVSLLLVVTSSLLLNGCGEISNMDNPKPNDSLQIDLINFKDGTPKEVEEKNPEAPADDSTPCNNAANAVTGTKPAPKKIKVRANATTPNNTATVSTANIVPNTSATSTTGAISATTAPQAQPGTVAEAPVLQTAPAPAAPVLSNWQPNEALLIRSNELIAGLQRDIGRKPNNTEMQQRLQTHMGLSAAQAQQVITVLGLNN